MFFLFVFKPVWAEPDAVGIRVKIHFVFLADHSKSMFRDGDIYIQSEAIAAAVTRYSLACENVFVSYIAWGNEAAEPIRLYLHDTSVTQQFTDTLNSSATLVTFPNTAHRKAIDAGLREIFTVYSEHTIAVLMTDEDGTNVQLQLPENVTLVKISIRDKEASVYLQNNFLPGVGLHAHADDVFELEELLNAVFSELTDLCLG